MALGSLGVAAAGASPAVAAGESLALQYFHEPWTTIESNLDAVANSHYDAIWIQQPATCKLGWEDKKARDDPPLGYQPIDLRVFDSPLGTEQELRGLIQTAHSKGIEVYVDTVMNHMATGQDPKYDFPQFDYDDFHHHGEIDYDDRESVLKGELLGLPDLKQEKSYVTDQLMNYMDKIADVGADGYRYDAPNHIPKWFFRDFANQKAENRGMFRVAETWHWNVHFVKEYVNTGPGMNALDYPLFFLGIDYAFNNGDMSKLKNTGLVDDDPFHACPFVDNHDKDGPSQYKLAHAFVTTIEGYPFHYNIDPTWILADPDIQNMRWVKTNLAGGATYWRHASSDLLIYERYNNLLVGLNNNTSGWKSKWVYTSWRNETLNDYAGNASGVSVDGNGWVKVSVPPEGWVFYAPY